MSEFPCSISDIYVNRANFTGFNIDPLLKKNISNYSFFLDYQAPKDLEIKFMSGDNCVVIAETNGVYYRKLRDLGIPLIDSPQRMQIISVPAEIASGNPSADIVTLASITGDISLAVTASRRSGTETSLASFYTFNEGSGGNSTMLPFDPLLSNIRVFVPWDRKEGVMKLGLLDEGQRVSVVRKDAWRREQGKGASSVRRLVEFAEVDSPTNETSAEVIDEGTPAKEPNEDNAEDSDVDMDVRTSLSESPQNRRSVITLIAAVPLGVTQRAALSVSSADGLSKRVYMLEVKRESCPSHLPFVLIDECVSECPEGTFQSKITEGHCVGCFTDGCIHCPTGTCERCDEGLLLRTDDFLPASVRTSAMAMRLKELGDKYLPHRKGKDKEGDSSRLLGLFRPENAKQEITGLDDDFCVRSDDAEGASEGIKELAFGLVAGFLFMIIGVVLLGHGFMWAYGVSSPAKGWESAGEDIKKTMQEAVSPKDARSGRFVGLNEEDIANGAEDRYGNFMAS